MIKAVFFDIDGTLVSFNTHKVPESTREALEMLRRRGVKTFISSGRQYASINNIPGLEFDGYVTVNGTIASVCQPDMEIIYRHPIPHTDIEHWLDYLDREKRSTIFVTEHGAYMNYANDQMNQIFDLLNFPCPPCSDLQIVGQETIYQIITTFTEDEEIRLMQYLPHCKTTRWHPLFTDIIERDGSKAMGIQAILDHYDYGHDEIMAFGDGGNDIEMLRLAGLGVAMGNATDEVKAYADYVTDSVDDDGVSKALKHFGLI